MTSSQSVVEDYDIDDVPPIVLVQRQLQDVIVSQQRSMEDLRERLAAERDMVPRERLDEILKDLQDERIARARTTGKLTDTQDKLQFAEGQVKILKRQLEQERDQFTKTQDMLKLKLLRETKKNVELENKCHEMSMEREHKTEMVNNQTNKIVSLSAKLAKEQSQNEQKLLESDLVRQQQMYVCQVMQEKDRKSLTHRKDGIAQKHL